MLEPMSVSPIRGGPSQGLTLMELLVMLAIIAVLGTLAAPSFSAFIARGRVSGAAEALAQDLNLARSESLRRNGDVTLSFSPGSAWCYGSVAGSTACSCATPSACTLRQVDGSAYTGVTMAMGTPAFLGNATTFTALQGLAKSGTVEFSHADAGVLRVRLSAQGQIAVCGVAGSFSAYPAC